MNLEEVLRETPMETLQRVRQRLKQSSAPDKTKKDTQKSTSSNSTPPSRRNNFFSNTILPATEMNLTTILEASGIDTTKMSSALINLDQTEQYNEKKSALTLSSLEYTANMFPFVDTDGTDESIMHLTAIPIKKTAPRHQSTPHATRSFTSLGTAVLEILRTMSLESPHVYFQAYTKLKVPDVRTSNCVEDNV